MSGEGGDKNSNFMWFLRKKREWLCKEKGQKIGKLGRQHFWMTLEQKVCQLGLVWPAAISSDRPLKLSTKNHRLTFDKESTGPYNPNKFQSRLPTFCYQKKFGRVFCEKKQMASVQKFNVVI